MWGCLTLSTLHCFRFLWTFSAPPWILPDLIFRGYWLIEICHSALFFSKQRVIWWNITETRTNHVSPLMTLMSSDSSDEASRLTLDQSIDLQQLMNMTEFGSCGYVSHVTSTQHDNNYILMLLDSQWLHFYSNRYVICTAAMEKSQTSSRGHVQLAILFIFFS